MRGRRLGVRCAQAARERGAPGGHRRRPGRFGRRRLGHPDDRIPGLLDPVPPPPDALPAGARPVSRPTPGCDGVPAGRPPSRAACSGATARWRTPCSAGTATRSRPISSTPRRARSIPRCRTGNAGSISTSSSRTSGSDLPTSARCRAATTRSTTPWRRPNRSARATPRCGMSSISNRSSQPDDRHAVRARLRRLNDLGFAVDEISLEPTSGRRGGSSPGGGRQPPVPCPRAPAIDRAGRARGAGPAPAQRPARAPGLARAQRR